MRAYLERSIAFSAPSFVLVARALHPYTAFIILPSSSLVQHSTAAPSFLPSFFSLLDTHAHVNACIFVLSLSPFVSFLHSHSHYVEKPGMRTPRYYVMPADRGSDILCMLMPHNVGFVPLFNVYLLGSPPGPIAFVANGVCVTPCRVSHPPDIALIRSRSRDV